MPRIGHLPTCEEAPSQQHPYAYLRDVLTRLPKVKMSEVSHLTPEAWQTAQRATQRRRAA